MWPQQIQALYPQCSRVVWECRSEDIESQRRRRGVGDRRCTRSGPGHCGGISFYSFVDRIYLYLSLFNFRSHVPPQLAPTWAGLRTIRERKGPERLFAFVRSYLSRTRPAHPRASCVHPVHWPCSRLVYQYLAILLPFYCISFPLL